MLTEARIREEVPAGLDWISELVDSGAVQPTLFDEVDLAPRRTPASASGAATRCWRPSARASAKSCCRNRRAPRADPQATRRAKRRLRAGTRSACGSARSWAGTRAKHFELDRRRVLRLPKAHAIAEAALDGLYGCAPACRRANSTPRRPCAPTSERRRTRLPHFKTVDLCARSTTTTGPRACLRVHAYYVQWHMRRLLAPLLFDDHEPHNAERASVVAPARTSPAARKKAQTKRTATDLLHSLRTLLDDLATIANNRVAPRIPGAEPFESPDPPSCNAKRACSVYACRVCTQ